MIAVTFIFSLNLFGVFEVLLPSSAVNRMATAGGTGMAGSFCEGIFATLLATPCSAPSWGPPSLLRLLPRCRNCG